MEFFSKLFEMRDTSHLMHLATKSYAEHKALDDFYNGILDLTDSLIESYQGIYGLQEIVIPESKAQEPVSYLQSCYKWIDDNRSSFKESFYQNQIDTIQELIASTLYKLRFLE